MTTSPSSPQAEKEILGAILENAADVMDLCAQELNPAAFFERPNRLIFEALASMHHSGTPINKLTLTSTLKDSGNLDAAGGDYYVFSLPTVFGTLAHIRFHVDEVKEKYRLRRILEVAAEAQNRVSLLEPSSSIISNSEASLFQLSNDSVSEENELHSASLEVDEAINRRMANEKVTGLASGTRSFDEPTGGYYNGLYYTVAGMPGAGKTAWGEQSAAHLALRGHPVLFISMEMRARRVLERMSAREAGVNYFRYLKNEISQSDLQRFKAAKMAIDKSPLQLIAPVDATGPKLRSIIRRAKRVSNIQLVVIDYLQLVKSDNMREERLVVAEASSCIREALKESNIPGIVISQMNREFAKEARPRMSHLAGSGQVERDSDVIVFLWPEVEKSELELGAPIPMNLTIEKNRDGPSGFDNKLLFDGPTLAFKERPKLTLYEKAS